MLLMAASTRQEADGYEDDDYKSAVNEEYPIDAFVGFYVMLISRKAFFLSTSYWRERQRRTAGVRKQRTFWILGWRSWCQTSIVVPAEEEDFLITCGIRRRWRRRFWSWQGAEGDAKYIQVRDKRNKEGERRFDADSIHTSSPVLLPSYLARVKATSNLPANLCYSGPHHKWKKEEYAHSAMMPFVSILYYENSFAIEILMTGGHIYILRAVMVHMLIL